jgi:Death domain
MSTSDDFFYGLDDDFRSMPLSTIESLSVILSDDSPMSDWRMVTDRLGYSSRQIEMFQQQARLEGRLPCSLMLSEWSKGYNRTVRVLKHVLTDMGRMDAVLQLDDERRRE